MILTFQMFRSDNSADEDLKKALQVFFPKDFQKAFNDLPCLPISGNNEIAQYSDHKVL